MVSKKLKTPKFKHRYSVGYHLRILAVLWLAAGATFAIRATSPMLSAEPLIGWALFMGLALALSLWILRPFAHAEEKQQRATFDERMARLSPEQRHALALAWMKVEVPESLLPRVVLPFLLVLATSATAGYAVDQLGGTSGMRGTVTVLVLLSGSLLFVIPYFQDAEWRARERLEEQLHPGIAPRDMKGGPGEQAVANLDSPARLQRQQHQRNQSVSSNPRRWFEVLNVRPNASVDEIREGWRRAIKQYHPDRLNGMSPELMELAGRRTQEINDAYHHGLALSSQAIKASNRDGRATVDD